MTCQERLAVPSTGANIYRRNKLQKFYHNHPVIQLQTPGKEKGLKWTAAKVKASRRCFCVYQQIKLKKSCNVPRRVCAERVLIMLYLSTAIG